MIFYFPTRLKFLQKIFPNILEIGMIFSFSERYFITVKEQIMIIIISKKLLRIENYT